MQIEIKKKIAFVLRFCVCFVHGILVYCIVLLICLSAISVGYKQQQFQVITLVILVSWHVSLHNADLEKRGHVNIPVKHLAEDLIQCEKVC